MADARIEAIAEVMRILGHDTRLRLIDALVSGGEKSVGEIEVLTGIGQPGLSQQLAILRKAGLVQTRRAAKMIYYSVAPTAFEGAASFLARLSGGAREEIAAAKGREASTGRGSSAMFAKIL